MISSDQPTCFPSSLIVSVSSRDDGTVLDRTLPNIHESNIVENRQKFCAKAGVDYERCVYQIIRYDDQSTYDVIKVVDAPSTRGVYADVLYTEMPGIGLFLPIADCVGTVIYDPVRRALALAHIGRHASIAKTMNEAIGRFIENGSNPADLTIWMAPSVAQTDYRMEYFDHIDDPDWQGFAESRDDGVYLDMTGYNRNLAQNCGVPSANIHISPVNTARDPNYFSHSQGDTNGRFAVLAMMR